MSSIFLSAFLSNSDFALKRQVPLLAEGRVTTIREIHSICTSFRQRAVCTMLLTGLPDGLQWHLMQSAAAYQHYLSYASERERVTSFAKPLFDAIVGSYMDAAREIAARSRPTWNPNYEYEDDFLYVFFLMQCFFLDASEDVQDTLLERYEAVVEGQFDVRLELCRAFRSNDALRFHDNLVRLLEERRARVDELVERGALSDEAEAWVRPFSLEGAALLKLADIARLPTDTHYPDIPEFVRDPSPYPFDPGAWRRLDAAPPGA